MTAGVPASLCVVACVGVGNTGSACFASILLRPNMQTLSFQTAKTPNTLISPKALNPSSLKNLLPSDTTGASIIRLGFGDILFYNYNKEPRKPWYPLKEPSILIIRVPALLSITTICGGCRRFGGPHRPHDGRHGTGFRVVGFRSRGLGFRV